MFTQAGSILLFLPLFFGDDPRPSHDFGTTVGRGIQDTTDINSTKPHTLHFPDKLWSHPAPAWISMGWMWSSDSISTVRYQEINQDLLDWPILIWPIPFDYGGALIIGEPDVNNP